MLRYWAAFHSPARPEAVSHLSCGLASAVSVIAGQARASQR